MAHQSQMTFVHLVRQRFPNAFMGAKVLEVGSLDINGSIRVFFQNCNYTGVDLGPGPGVDLVESGENLSFPDGTFDTVASCECFEHNRHWDKTFLNMHRMCKSGGVVFFSCATTGRPEHGTHGSKPEDSPFTHEYYKNLSQNDFAQFDLNGMFSDMFWASKHPEHDLYFVGVKR